ncbi:hypothetical protein FRC12_024964 [Ceratobasidium sp. 428]|nr:hypothetical protein FRC12_024964 [Ceratobasidium sp. 428]
MANPHRIIQPPTPGGSFHPSTLNEAQERNSPFYDETAATPDAPRVVNLISDDLPVAPTTPGLFVRRFPGAGASRAGHVTPYAEHQALGRTYGMPWFPARSELEWQYMKILFTSGQSQAWINEFLQLGLRLPVGDIHEPDDYILPMFHNFYSLRQLMDLLPRSGEWKSYELDLGTVSDDGEPIVLYTRDPIECIRQLARKPMFADRLVFAPQKESRDRSEQDRIYGEMWTCDWWWDTQRLLPQGATLIPVILASDKTNLTALSGSKQAYPVYITIGNIPADIRRQESSGASEVLAYLPVSKLPGYSTLQRRVLLRDLFHQSMTHVLEPL